MGSRPICACTCLRKSAIIFCADFDSSCVNVKEVSPCTTVAASTASTIGVSNCIWCFPITSSTKYFVEAGRQHPTLGFRIVCQSSSAMWKNSAR